MIVEVKKSLEYIKQKADQGIDPKTIQNIKPDTVQIQQPETVQNKLPEAVQNKLSVETPQGCTLNVEDLKISGSHSGRYWTFVSISESPSEEAIKVAKMRECYYLEVKGTFDTKNLTSGTRYEVVFVVKIEDTMSIWDDPAKVQLMVPEKELQERELQFVDLTKNEWVEIQAGVFDAQPHKAQMEFYLYQHDSKKKKTGLVVKGAIIRPLGQVK
ncbi:unnamed protein product [Arabis nemorensis]|uniref:Uncharacterized protein n=1 Tax=Arabis nemorensis TaxID=586526 RepID=A0A565C2U3_9BRAS|nr:unnamed protein product [Arabis nemorensis]